MTTELGVVGIPLLAVVGVLGRVVEHDGCDDAVDLLQTSLVADVHLQVDGVHGVAAVAVLGAAAARPAARVAGAHHDHAQDPAGTTEATSGGGRRAHAQGSAEGVARELEADAGAGQQRVAQAPVEAGKAHALLQAVVVGLQVPVPLKGKVADLRVCCMWQQ